MQVTLRGLAFVWVFENISFTIKTTDNMNTNDLKNETPTDAKHVLAAGFYRCGWCGQPTNKEGQPLTIDECKQLTDEQLNSAELLNGDCCPPQQERETIIVTRDMAIDAGDLSLEGQLWVW